MSFCPIGTSGFSRMNQKCPNLFAIVPDAAFAALSESVVSGTIVKIDELP